MTEKPERPADERPNGPFYIDDECPYCGTELVPYDNSDWNDEFICPDCDDGVHMDWPEEYRQSLMERIKATEAEDLETIEGIEEVLDSANAEPSQQSSEQSSSDQMGDSE